jgi:uncharacterized protein YcnI
LAEEHTAVTTRWLRILAGAPALGVALALGVAVMAGTTPAGAHVDADPTGSTVAPDGTATVQFSFDHGCDGEPTTSLRVQIPDGVSDVEPQPVDGWQTNVGATEFSWTGGSTPDDQPAIFVATMRVTGQQGATIWFPAVQGCPTAEEAWIEIPVEGEPEPANPAPGLLLPYTIEPTGGPSPTTAAPSTTRTTLVPGEAAVTPEGSPRDNTGLVVGLVAVGAIVAGAVVLYLRYRGRGNTTA